MSKKIIIANWKMNPASEKEAISLAKTIDKNGVVISPPFIYLPALKKILKRAKLGAQDLFYEKDGSHTGEISPAMLKNLGVKYVIIGHSERRALGETSRMVNKKLKAALKSNIIPIICIGESYRDADMKYLSFVKKQIEESFYNLTGGDFKKIIIAYEPIWAIGKTAVREATPPESMEMAIFIKKVLSDRFGPQSVKNVNIIYGGSVNNKNAGEFLEHGGVSGLLVGRVSLEPEKFNEILKNA